MYFKLQLFAIRLKRRLHRTPGPYIHAGMPDQDSSSDRQRGSTSRSESGDSFPHRVDVTAESLSVHRCRPDVVSVVSYEGVQLSRYSCQAMARWRRRPADINLRTPPHSLALTILIPSPPSAFVSKKVINKASTRPHPYHSGVMDEHDFDQILQTDFHPNTAPPAEHHSQVQQQQDQAQQVEASQREIEVANVQHVDDTRAREDKPEEYTLEHVQQLEPEHDLSATDRYESGSPHARPQSVGREGSGSDVNLTVADKKRRQKELNRLAASRSRKKKQGELYVLYVLSVPDCRLTA